MIHPTSPRWPALTALVAALVVQACSPVSGPPNAGTSSTEPATTTTATAAPATNPEGTHVGSWLSPSCGERTYGRQLHLAADGTFQAQDLVSPCPPKVACVWSGIIHRQGTYTLADGKIVLTEKGEAGPQGKPLPATLGVDSSTHAPFETDSAGKVCPYAYRAKSP